MSFGVSGRLYHSNLLLYDRETDSLWSQITAEAVAGRLTGAKLEAVPSTIITWREWKEQHPHTLVLAERRVPAIFSALGKALQTLIPPLRSQRSSHPQTPSSFSELVLGVTVGEEKKAYPLDELARSTAPFTTDTVKGTEVRLFFSPTNAFAYAENKQEERLPSVVTYRATWLAFYPHSQLYSAPR